MTNKIAVAIGLFLVLAFIVDALAFGGNAPIFLAGKFANLVEWVAFWR